MEGRALAEQVRQEAARLGFDLCRLVSLGDTHANSPGDGQPSAPHADFYDAWIGSGRAGEMTYLERYREKRRFPQRLAETEEGLHTMIVLGVDYHQFDLAPSVRSDPSRGIIASYAWGDDYHEIIRPLLHELDAAIRSRSGRRSRGKALVDTGPVLERDWAHRAGLGFTGKNCCTIHPERGSWLFLATLLVPERMPSDPPPRPVAVTTHSAAAVLAGLSWKGPHGAWEIPLVNSTDSPAGFALGTCGRCTRCLDACPTDAFVGPFHLDPQRCISYWTIEARGSIPEALRPAFGNRIFGCDICQEVCPWNQRLVERTPLLAGLVARRERMAPPLLEGFAPETPYWLAQDAFSSRFRRSPVKRAKRQGMLRNVCVALGNWADPAVVPALCLALGETNPLIREHAAWALGCVVRTHGHDGARQALAEALAREDQERVRGALSAALG